MEERERQVASEKDTAEDKLLGLDPEEDGWFTKLARIEKAKAVRRETRKARKGKPMTFSAPVGW